MWVGVGHSRDGGHEVGEAELKYGILEWLAAVTEICGYDRRLRYRRQGWRQVLRHVNHIVVTTVFPLAWVADEAVNGTHGR